MPAESRNDDTPGVDDEGRPVSVRSDRHPGVELGGEPETPAELRLTDSRARAGDVWNVWARTFRWRDDDLYERLGWLTAHYVYLMALPKLGAVKVGVSRTTALSRRLGEWRRYGGELLATVEVPNRAEALAAEHGTVCCMIPWTYAPGVHPAPLVDGRPLHGYTEMWHDCAPGLDLPKATGLALTFWRPLLQDDSRSQPGRADLHQASVDFWTIHRASCLSPTG